MPATVTVTGTNGPGFTLTTAVFANVTSFRVDTNNNMLYMEQSGVALQGVSIAAATTVTATKSGNTWTLTIS